MSVYDLIGHFLEENDFKETLSTFEKEYGKPILKKLPTGESLQEIIDDRLNFKDIHTKVKIDEFQDDELRHLQQSLTEWSSPYPSRSKELKDVVPGLVIDALVSYPLLFLSAADLNIYVVDLTKGKVVYRGVVVPEKVVIKHILPIAENHLMFVGMNGIFYQYTYDPMLLKFELISKNAVHSRLVTEVKLINMDGELYFVSLGWDFYLKTLKLNGKILEPIDSFKLSVQGTCIDVVNYRGKLVIVVGLNDTTSLSVFVQENTKLDLKYKVSLNDAEFTTNSFTPRDLSICPRKDINETPIVAVGTSHEPFMRLIVVSLKELFKISSETEIKPIKRNQIIKNLNSLSPQDRFSTAKIEWRFDGSGVWIASEDGNIRGLDLLSEENVVDSEAHRGKIKVFKLFNNNGEESLISCGIDREVKIWN